MKLNKAFSIFALLTLIFSALTPVPAQARAADSAASSRGASPAGLLKADGTLNLDGSFRGALDLAGYSVQLDPARGPVFGPSNEAKAAPATLVAPGDWFGLDGGGGPVDDAVDAIAIIGTDVYVGGNFADLANIPAADFIAKWDGSNWSALGSQPNGNGALDNYVYALAVSGSNLYVGGAFFVVANNSGYVNNASYLAKWDGAAWSGLGGNGSGGSSLTNTVSAIAVSGSNVYAGGYFQDINNSGTTLNAADYVAKWDGANWSALKNDGAGNGSISGNVTALAVDSGGNLYVGGYFTDVKNGSVTLQEADYVTKWDGSNWSGLGDNGLLGASKNGSINASNGIKTIVTSGTDVYVGGGFINVNNKGTILNAADYIARWNSVTGNWSALGSGAGGDGSLNSIVSAILISGTDFYVSGSFQNVDDNGTSIPTADEIVKWDSLSGHWSGIGTNGAGDGSFANKGYVGALAMQGSNLLVGGWFTDINDGGTPQLQADFLAQWNGTHWSSMGTSPNGALVNGWNGSGVRAIAVIGTDVYVGGAFTDISNHGANMANADNIAKWDSVTGDWSALGSDGAGGGALKNFVSALTVNGTDLYVGGNFTNAAGISEADYVAKWNGSSWSALGSNGASDGVFTGYSYVNSLTFSGSSLYIGGYFSNLNGIAEADNIARWDGASWSALGSNGTGNGALTNSIQALAVDSLGNIYAGGGFLDVANIPEADYIAKWDPTANGGAGGWFALGNSGAGISALNDSVFAVAASGTDVYAGGVFTNAAGNAEADYIAKWDGSSWSALGNNGTGNGAIPAAGGRVNAILVSGTDVFAGGQFLYVNNKGTALNAAQRIARWDGLNWSALGSNGASGGAIPTNSFVNALGLLGSNLLVGGNFSNVSNNGVLLPTADYIAGYSIPAHIPVTYTVTKLADTNDGVCDNDCSLREAIGSAANTDAIVFAPNLQGIITLTSELTVGANVSITGLNGNVVAVSGNDATRIFHIQSGASVQISNLTLDHGYVADNNGGAILNDGNLILSYVTISNSHADSSSSSVNGNGGGIYSANHGSLTITDSHITGNMAGYSGGGIYAAVDSGAAFSLNHSFVDTNTASMGNGGGIYLPNPGANAPGTISIWQSGIYSNVDSAGNGGGIHLEASADISTTYITGNNMQFLIGGGGGMEIYEGGAGFKPITVNINNVTISGNSAVGQGGGVEVSLQQAADSVTFNNVTISDNHRTVVFGVPALYGGGGIYATGSDFPILENTIVAGNTSLNNDGTTLGGPDCEGTFGSADYNLIQDISFCTLNGVTTHNITGVSANLAALTKLNGTMVMPVFLVSPALNAGNNATCIVQDQRGYDRPSGGKCDIGAYELQQGSATVKSTAAQDGWVLAKTSANATGGTMNASATTLRLGDDAAKKQYRDTLSFTTQTLPDNAVITKVTLRLKQSSITGGGDPITMFGGFMVDVKKGTFGTASLQLTDFASASNKTVGPFKPALTSGWYSINLTAAKLFVNKMTTGSGLTQIRLRFKTPTNNNAVANYLNIFSGNAGVASRPQLIVEYYVP